MKFPPINLWSKQIQTEYEHLLYELLKIEKEKITLAALLELSDHRIERTEKRLKELDFIYYTRTGKFIND